MLTFSQLLTAAFALFASITAHSSQLPVSKNKRSYEKVIQLVAEKYNPVFLKHGKRLTIIRDWANPEVNAGALPDLKEPKIIVYGGLYRLQQMSNEGFLAVLCHEIGHHLGGKPKKTYNVLSSAEGQADYYATNTCLPFIYEGMDNRAFINKNPSSRVILQKCNYIYHENTEASFICQRSLQASLSFAAFLNVVNASKSDLGMHLREHYKAKETNTMYPTEQCRLDTFLAGALCDRRTPLSMLPGQNQNCSPRKVLQHAAARPECWYVGL